MSVESGLAEKILARRTKKMIDLENRDQAQAWLDKQGLPKLPPKVSTETEKWQRRNILNIDRIVKL